VIGSDSPEGALTLLKQLKVRNDSVALLLADQRMPHMDGVAFLQEAMHLIFPDAKRALLTAYADTNAAISAINQANINFFFMKPWDPPAEHLYPQLDDLLDDWRASYRPAFEGIRVLGTRWSPRSYELRDFLARNRVPYQWIDVEASANDPETKRLLEALGPEASNLPVVLFQDGTKLLDGVPSEVAQRVGLRTRAQTNFYDLAIVGGGPGGSGRRRLWGVRRLAHRDDRARSSRRPGGNELAHRELSRISRRASAAAIWRAARWCRRSALKWKFSRRRKR
jgi:thioredoxin reductase (NADPH)